MMQILGSWGWRKLYMPPKIARQRNNVIKVLGLKLINRDLDLAEIRRHPVVFITGDGNTLPADVKEFQLWDVPHDLYAVNRSLIFHERPVQHWAAIDIEESCWFSQNVNSKIQNGHPILRHTIGEIPIAYDVWWEMDYQWENDFQRRVFVGNTGYFAILTALAMGYEKIIVGGMPLNREPHFYETEAAEGPNWNGLTYTQWMDFKMLSPGAEKVRSLGGYSAFILGQATKEWVNASR